jgi:hypothetical protein
MKDHKNRMNEAQTRGPGRPTQQELKENPPKPAKFIEVNTISLVCPCCGRGAMTRVLDARSEQGRRKHLCLNCRGRFIATYNQQDKPISVRVLK